jgi:RNA-directed DNA polymerase
MGDTQRSQTMSPENQRIAEQLVLNQRMFVYPDSERPPVMVGQSSLEWIKVLAVNEPEMVFTSLAHRIDFHLLKHSFRQVRGSKSCGVDNVTAK